MKELFTTVKDIYSIIKLPLILVSVLSTVGFVLMFAFEESALLTAIGGILIIVGTFAALLSGPIKYLKLLGKFASVGWSLGFTLAPFGFIDSVVFGIAASAVAATAGCLLVMLIPSAIGLWNYFLVED